MNNPMIEPTIIMDMIEGKLSGPQVIESRRTIAELEGVFRDEPARKQWMVSRLYIEL